jgi:hypothetical protein
MHAWIMTEHGSRVWGGSIGVEEMPQGNLGNGLLDHDRTWVKSLMEPDVLLLNVVAEGP